MNHHTYIKVRGYHLDGYQHVNNARYLEFLEEARWGYLEQHGDIEHFEQPYNVQADLLFYASCYRGS